MIYPHEWAPHVHGEAEFLSLAEAKNFSTLVMRLFNQVTTDLIERMESQPPPEMDEESVSQWCAGYL
jgi:uncharacterized protein YecA (UPF0149 family)